MLLLVSPNQFSLDLDECPCLLTYLFFEFKGIVSGATHATVRRVQKTVLQIKQQQVAMTTKYVSRLYEIIMGFGYIGKDVLIKTAVMLLGCVVLIETMKHVK